ASIRAETAVAEPGGNISLEVGTLNVTGGSFIASQTNSLGGFFGTGSGQLGDVTVRASDSVGISGRSPTSPSQIFSSPSQIFSSTSSSGKGGYVRIFAPSLIMDDGGIIQADTLGTGRGGDIVLEVGRLSLTGGAGIRTHSTGAQGGNVTVRETDSVSISGRDRISPFLPSGISSTTREGTAGNILLDVGKLKLTDGGVIQSGTPTDRQGGNVTVMAKDSIIISGGDSGISNQALNLPAGPMVISAPTLTMDNGLIRADTQGSGGGGDISLGVDKLSLTGGARISTSSSGQQASGNAGDINVTARDSVSIFGKSSGGQESGLFSTASPRQACLPSGCG